MIPSRDERLQNLRTEVYEANIALHRDGLAPETWGNVSGIDRTLGVLAIKPSGVPYPALRPESIVCLSVDSGEPLANANSALRPSSDTPTHLELYRRFPEIGGIAHAHSRFATAFAQALRPLPCLGTTHADHFRGEIPLTRPLTPEEIQREYERNTGRIIAERFQDLDPLDVPAVLVAGHGPFTWGKNAIEAFRHARILETIAELALYTLLLGPETPPLSPSLLARHFSRKHGPNAYYGQK